MKILKILVPSIVVILLVLAAIAPLGPMPGFFIGGTQTSVPDEWFDTSSIHEVQLEAQGTLPRVVIIWVIQVDKQLYVVGSKDSGWVSLLDRNGDVRIRIEDKTYAMTASLVRGSWEPILQAYMDKYRPDYPDIVNSFPSMEVGQESMAVFVLSAR